MKGARSVSAVGLCGVAVVALLALQVSVAADGYPRVVANVGLTTHSKSAVRDDAIPAVTVDPNDPRHIVVAEGDFRAGSCGIFYSTDGGATFTAGKRSPMPPQFTQCTPNAGAKAYALAWAKDGSLLFATVVLGLKSEVFDGPASVLLARTSDNGTTWQTTLVRDNRTRTPPEGAWQIHMVSNPATNTVYVGWQERDVPGIQGWQQPVSRAYVATSTDGGVTFGTPVDITSGAKSPRNEMTAQRGPSLAVAPDGSLYAEYAESIGFDPTAAPPEIANLPTHLVVARSTDQGKTFTYADVREVGDFTDYPEIAVAQRAHGGYSLVTVYEDLADGAAGDQQVRDIYSQRSSNKGTTWTDRVRVTDDNLLTDLGNKFVPGISAAPNGRVDVAWIDFRNDTGNLLTDTYYASSTDGGATWSKNVKISDAPSDRHYGQFANYSDVRGPVGIASSNYAALAAWDDTRKANASTDVQDVFFGAVQQSALPDTTSTVVLYIIAAVSGGLVLAALILVGAGLVIRRRRAAPEPTLVSR